MLFRSRSRGVASAQFWRGLRSAAGAFGYIGGPELLLPPYFEASIAADDDAIKTPRPPGAREPRPGRYVVDLLHQDPAFQARIRVHLANPWVSRHSRTEFIVVSRRSTLERDTAAMLDRRYACLHTFPKGSVVAARSSNWSNGGLQAIQSNEDWEVWVPKNYDEAETLRARLIATVLSRDGVLPFDPECPSMKETLLGVTGNIYAQGGLIVATDGSVRKDGSMGAGACWSRPIRLPFSSAVHGPPKSIFPELAGLAIAVERSPLDEDLTILTDSKISLQLLRGMQRQDFPVFCQRRAELPLLERTIRALNGRVEAGRRTRLIKVRAHVGEPLNTIADHLATKCADQAPIEIELDPLSVLFYCPRPTPWSPRVRNFLAEISTATAYTKFRQARISLDQEPPTGAPASRLMNQTETWLAREGAGRCYLGAALRVMIPGPRKRRLLQSIGRTFPGQALLHRWNVTDSPACRLCGADEETLVHIQCLCPRLEGARTAAHHLVARSLWSEIAGRQRGRAADFSLSAEVEVRDMRDLVPPGGDHTRSSIWDRVWSLFFSQRAHPLDPQSLARLRPDAVCIRWDRKAMFLLEMTRPYDQSGEFAARSDELKLERYRPVVDMFNEVGQEWGWTAAVIPLTIGIRGSVNEREWAEHLARLDIASRDVPHVLQTVVDSALEALDLVYQARRSALLEAPHASGPG